MTNSKTMLMRIVLYHRGEHYNIRYLNHTTCSLKKSKTTCTNHIKNNNVIALFTHVLIMLKKKYTDVSTLYWNVTYLYIYIGIQSIYCII